MKIIYCAGDETIEKRWKEFLQEQEDTAAASSIDQVYGLLKNTPNSILILHIPQEGLLNTNDLRALRERHDRARVVILSDRPETAEGLAVLKEGVYGYCNTYITKELFLQVINTVNNGEVWVGWQLMQHLIHNIPKAEHREQEPLQLETLTNRELQITQLVATGMSNKRIAKTLDISERTVKNHLHSIFQKTGVEDRLNLAIRLKGQPPLVIQ